MLPFQFATSRLSLTETPCWQSIPALSALSQVCHHILLLLCSDASAIALLKRELCPLRSLAFAWLWLFRSCHICTSLWHTALSPSQQCVYTIHLTFGDTQIQTV